MYDEPMSDDEIEIGLAAPADVPGVVELCMLVEEQHEAYWPLRWQRRTGIKEGYLAWMSRRVVEGGKSRMLTAVARDKAMGGQVVGAILVTIEKEVPIYTYSEYAFVQDLAVRESHRRRGIAQELLAAAAEWAKGYGLNQLRLMVAHQNPSARAAFAKAGFRATYEEMVLPLENEK